MKLITIVSALTFLNFIAGNLSAEECAFEYTKIGCFKDRVLPEDSLSTELIYKSNPKYGVWNISTLDWKEWSGSLERLACACAEKAKLLGNNYFGLYFFGKCWSGSELKHNNRSEHSTSCISKGFNECNDSSSATCVGKANTNYIYRIVQGSKYSAPGYWSEWSEWSECSASCDGGLRSRTSTYNVIKKIGIQYDRKVEHALCNEEACVCINQVEVGFLLDASTSVKLVGWNKALNFVKNFPMRFKMGLTGLRFAVIDFSDEATLQMNFPDSSFWNHKAFSEKISAIEYSRGKTRTDFALEVARTQVFCNECGLRPNIPKLLIVLTDGISTFPDETLVEAQLIKVVNNLTIISVGVGKRIDMEELNSLATNKDRVFVLNDYSNLSDTINKLVISCESEPKIPIHGGWENWIDWTKCSASCNGGIRIRERRCNNPLPQNGGIDCKGESREETTCNEEKCEPVCTSEMEIAMLLDASSSVTLANWYKTQDFVQDFSKGFKIGLTGVRFAVVEYSDNATIQVDILDPRYWSNNAFNKKIKEIRYIRGRTRTDLALKLIRDKVFCEECGLRVNVPKLVMVVTDGRSSEPKSTRIQALKVKSLGSIRIISVGVGHEVNIKELKAMATDDNHVFTLDSYNVISDKVNQMLKISCKRKT